jgi:Fic family protein
MSYNWQEEDWPKFTYKNLNVSDISDRLWELSAETRGLLQQKNSVEQEEEILCFLLSEATKTSEIEGEFISREDLLSSIRNNLGINLIPENIKDRRAKGIADLLLEVRHTYSKRLTETDLTHWHSLLFNGSKAVRAGKYRVSDAAMQVVSGASGRERVHYEAPPSVRVPQEMKNFVKWYNGFQVEKGDDMLIKTAIAHLYFESIHPFEDGNGRIGRAIAEKCLAQSFGAPVLFSISSIIEKNKKLYYDMLKNAQRTLDISEWISYFAEVIVQAQAEGLQSVKFSFYKMAFFDRYSPELNERERKAINKMFAAGVAGFEGGMTAKKYSSITRASKTTATRDLQHLVQIHALVTQGKGRNVHYQLSTAL